MGERGGSTNRCKPRCWQAGSNSAANSEPPSTCRARRGKGMRCSRVSRNWAAVWAVARVWAWITSQRATTSQLTDLGFGPERPRDASWGERYFHMLHPDGHELSFAQPI